MATKIKLPNLTDKHIGGRVRMRRMMLGLSQERLGDALGLTFQQVQKYEKGINRIGGSRMQQIAHILDCEPAFFFEGAPTLNSKGIAMLAKNAPIEYVMDFCQTTEGLATAKAMMRITDTKIRKRFVDLLEETALLFSERAA